MSEKFRITPFFNGVSAFKNAFPDLQDAVVEWRERRGPEDEKSSDLRKTGFRRGNFTQGVIPCSNPDCHEGGYELDKLVASMIRDGENERSGMLLCSGKEVGEEVRRGPVRCPHRIDFKAMLTPRTSEPREPKQTGGRPRDNRDRRNRYRPRRRDNVA